MNARNVFAIGVLVFGALSPGRAIGVSAFEDIRPGWLQVSPEDSTGARTIVLRNLGRLPLRYSSSPYGPPYEFLRQTKDDWCFMGPGWCGNGFHLEVLGPGDSVEFRVPTDTAPQGKLRVAVALASLDQHDWFFAASEDSFDFARSGKAGTH